MTQPTNPKPANPLRYFNSSPEVIRAAVMLYIRLPLILRIVEDLLFERGIDICHETVRLWWNRLGPLWPPRFGASGYASGMGQVIGAGTLMRCSSGSTARWSISRWSIYGGRSITRGKSLRAMRPKPEINHRLCALSVRHRGVTVGLQRQSPMVYDPIPPHLRN
jgi:hypothetical protein